jgi:hypothetical protein
VCPDYENFVVGRNGIKAEAGRIFSTYRNVIQSQLENAISRVSFTSDIWTCNHTNAGFMAVTAHFVTENWKYVDIVLNFKKIPPHHTGYNICQAFKEVVREWRLEDKIMAITLDNASSNAAFIDELLRANPAFDFIKSDEKPLIHIRCFAHILNLIAEDGLKVMRSSIEGLRNAIKKIRNSQVMAAAFRTYCDECAISPTQAKPAIDVPTRWNSTYNMFETSIPYLEAFDAWSRDSDQAPAPVDPFHRLDIEDFHKFLKPLKDMTSVVSTHKQVSIHEGLTYIYALRKQLLDLEAVTEKLRTAKAAMILKFEKYFNLDQPRVNLTVYFVASIFDPRSKLATIKKLFPEDEADQIVRKIDTIYGQYYSPLQATSSFVSDITLGSSSIYASLLGKFVFFVFIKF